MNASNTPRGPLVPTKQTVGDMQGPKLTIDLPFSPEDVRTGRIARDDKFDKAWGIIQSDPELAFARKRLSMHELRHIIRAVSAAFS